MDQNTTSIVSALGAGSGIDMVALANNLAEVRYAAQIEQFQARSESLEARISAASLLRSQLNELASAVGERIRNGDLAPSASIGDPSVALVDVDIGGEAGGNFTLEVSQIASAQTLASKSYASTSDLVGAGTLTIRFGEVAGAAFTEDTSQTAIDITIEATDTLANVAEKLRLEAGLNAYTINTGNGTQLVLKGAEGANNGFVLEGSSGGLLGGAATPGNLEYLSWNPATDAGELKRTAQNAEFELDGVATTSPSNTVTGLPSGLSLTLTGTNIGAPTNISFADNSAQISGFMGDFVAALNDITGALNELANPRGGDLGNDSGTRALKRALSGLTTEIVMPGAVGNEPSTLGDLGLTIDRNGTFSLDTDRLQATLANEPEAAGAMFTTGLFGVFATMDNLARTMSDRSDPGSLFGSEKRYTSQIERIDERLERINEQQERLRERLVSTFAAADTAVGASQSTLSFLQSQIEIWNNSNNR